LRERGHGFAPRPDLSGGAELDLMRRIKAAIDPAGLMNPGKLFPP